MTENQSPHDLLLRVQSGSRTALDTLYTLMCPRLYSDLLHEFGSTLTEKDIEDVIHNTFVKIILLAQQYNGISARGWIYSIARHEALRMIETSKKTPHSLDGDENEDPTAVPEENSLMNDPDWEGEGSVENRAIRSSTMKEFRKVAKDLSPKEQDVLEQRYDEGNTYKEIGDRSDRTKVWAKQKHDGAISKIRKYLRLD